MRYLIFLIVFLLSSVSFAQDPNHSPYEVEPAIEIPITIGIFAAAGLPRTFAGPSVYCGAECYADDVNDFDRTVIGYHSSTSNMISNVSFVASVGLPFALSTIDTMTSSPTDGWGGYSKDVLVLSETLIATLSINNIINMAVQRPRPLVFDHVNFTEEERLHRSAVYSFPSGHTSVAFAMGTAYSRLYMQRHPDSPWVIPVWVGTYSLASASGLGRVFAGEHFWTDILAGAGLGVSTGLLIPWLHESSETEESKVSIMPVPYDGGAGLNVSKEF